MNALKPIQLGFTFVTEPPHPESNQLVVFQFNLQFDRNEDMFTDEAMQAYEEAGFNFQRHNVSSFDAQFPRNYAFYSERGN